MTAATRTASNNRTNVRFLVQRLALRALDKVAPAAAERWVVRLWSTPRRTLPARPPEVPGLIAHPFTVVLPDPASSEGGPEWAFLGPDPRERDEATRSVARDTTRSAPTRLAAWSWGEGPAVLLVHGWSGHAGQMAGFVAPLVGAGFRVVAFDQPAHGLSAGPRTNSLRMRDAVRAVGQQVGALHALVGHSLGATAAVLAMAQDLWAERLVLVAPPAEAPLFARAFSRALGLSAARAEAVVRRAERMAGIDFASIDLRRIAPRMRTPLLVIHDANDGQVPFAHGQEIAQAWPEARLMTTRGLGHARLLRAPEVVGAAVDFVVGQAVGHENVNQLGAADRSVNRG
jgi:pimeloyl-ACP methyl ester carboxylesterase